jgi:prepilin-type N-terminal cleavage/methylation domain-containing protein
MRHSRGFTLVEVLLTVLLVVLVISLGVPQMKGLTGFPSPAS